MGKGPFRGLGGMANMGNLMMQAQKMQKNIENAQQAVSLLSVEGSAGGDKVKLTLNGEHKISDLTIAPEVCDPEDTEMLADLIMAAYNNANEQLEAQSGAIMGKATNGINLPF